MSAATEDPFSGSRMSLGEHLDELRSRLVKGLAAVVIAFVAAWAFRDRVADFVLAPYRQSMDLLEVQLQEEADALLAADPSRARTAFYLTSDPADRRLLRFDKRALTTAPGETFFFHLKIALYAALFAGSPFLLWQLWRFVSAGLYRHERRALTRFFPVSLGLFVLGVGFGFRWMVPWAMYFLNADVSIELVIPDIKLADFLTFLSSLCLALGVVFQLPVVMGFLGMSGLVQPATMARYRGHFLVGAFVVAAILTPPDPFTQVLLGVPMAALYEVGIWSARLLARREQRRAAEGAA